MDNKKYFMYYINSLGEKGEEKQGRRENMLLLFLLLPLTNFGPSCCCCCCCCCYSTSCYCYSILLLQFPLTCGSNMSLQLTIIGSLSPLARVRVLLSSNTEFRFSIHIGSTGPSNTSQMCSPFLAWKKILELICGM